MTGVVAPGNGKVCKQAGKLEFRCAQRHNGGDKHERDGQRDEKDVS